MLPTGSRTQQTSSAYAAATSADHELLVEFELFDAQGRWNPRNVIFYTKDDSTREKKLSTRCFRGLMAWYGKLWAKNYLSRHFKDKPESNALLQQIKHSDFVNYKAFEETVARCTLLYSDLQQAAASNTSVSSSNVITPSIKGIDKVVLQYFMKIDWGECAEKKQFDWITLEMAKNIDEILKNFDKNDNNNKIVEKLRKFMFEYKGWLNNPSEIEERNNLTDKYEIFSHDINRSEHEEIASIIFKAIEEYHAPHDINKIISGNESFNESYQTRWAEENQTLNLSTVDETDGQLLKNFFEIDWEEWRRGSKFNWITLEMALGLKKYLSSLTPNESNDLIVEKLWKIIDEYKNWIKSSQNSKRKESNDTSFQVLNDLKVWEQNEIVDSISNAIDEYCDRSDHARSIEKISGAQKSVDNQFVRQGEMRMRVD